MAEFGNNFIVKNLLWSDFKILASSKGILTSLQYDIDTSQNVYQIFCVDGILILLCNIWLGSVPPDSLYTQTQNDIDKDDFENNYKSKCNNSLQVKTADGIIICATGKTDAAKVNFYTHDWTNPCTWYESSIRVVDEIATTDGYYTTYNLLHNYVIDTCHGNITQEDFLKDNEGNSYRISVKVNDIIKIEQDIHYGYGGDFTVNYIDGKIIFLTPLTDSDIIKVTYHYMVDSTFIVKPNIGHALKIDIAEVQFSQDIILTDSIVFQPYGLVDIFAPQLMPSIPSGTKIPLGNPVIYKTISDYQNEAMRSYPMYPIIGGNGWRGSSQPILIMNWDYLASTIIKDSAGMEIRIKLQHDTPFEGFFATATFYCTSYME